MCNQEHLDILKSIFAQSEIIDENNLFLLNFHPKTIEELLEEKILSNTGNGIYKMGSKFPKDDSFGNRSLLVPFVEFESILKRGSYRDAAIMLDSGVDVPSHNKTIFNIYLILLTQIINVNDEYEQIVKNLNLSDFLSGSDTATFDDKLYTRIFERKNASVFRTLFNNTDQSDNHEHSIIYQMVNQILTKAKEDREIELKLQRGKQFADLKKFLEKKETICSLSTQESLALILVRRILEAREGKLQVCFDTNSSNIFEAVSNCDYMLAKKLNDEYNRENKYGNNAIIDALIDELVATIKKDYGIATVMDIQDKIDPNNEIKTYKSTKKNNIKLYDILSSMISDDIDGTMDMVDTYFNDNGKQNYVNLAKNYIRLAVIDDHSCFKTACKALIDMDNDKYEYLLLPHLLAFCDCVKENPKKAEIYLDMVREGQNLGVCCIFLPDMERQLVASRQDEIDNFLEKRK